MSITPDIINDDCSTLTGWDSVESCEISDGKLVMYHNSSGPAKVTVATDVGSQQWDTDHPINMTLEINFSALNFFAILLRISL